MLLNLTWQCTLSSTIPHAAVHLAKAKQCDCLRVRVTDIKFHPVPTEVQLRGDDGNDNSKGTEGNPFSPLEITASINGEGLGLTIWWSEGEAEAMSE